jgi:hypothetical protein
MQWQLAFTSTSLITIANMFVMSSLVTMLNAAKLSELLTKNVHPKLFPRML